MFQTKAVEKIKTHTLYSMTFSRKSFPVRDKVEKYGRAGQTTDGSIIWRMRFELWVIKAADTHSEYIILIDFSLQQRLCQRFSLLRDSTLPVLL